MRCQQSDLVPSNFSIVVLFNATADEKQRTQVIAISFPLFTTPDVLRFLADLRS